MRSAAPGASSVTTKARARRRPRARASRAGWRRRRYTRRPALRCSATSGALVSSATALTFSSCSRRHDRLPDAAESADDDMVLERRAVLVGSASPRDRACVNRSPSAAADLRQQRRHHHAQADHRDRRRCELRRHQMAAARERRSRRRRTPPPARAAARPRPPRARDPERAGGQEQDRRLDRDSPSDRPRTIQPTCAATTREIDARADRDEEDAEQQSLERLEVDLDVMPVLGLAEQQAGEERAERHRQAGRAGHARRQR